MKIGNHDLAKDGVYIIAEAGVNHNGSVQIAKQLVDAAVDAGAHAVKFQMYKAASLVTEAAHLADYQKRSGIAQTQKELLEKYELTSAQFKEIKRYCEARQIVFLATPFDLQSAETLHRMGVAAFKVGSGDLTYVPLLKKLAQFNKPILLSTGMSTFCEIDKAVQHINRLNQQAEIVLLHCTSSYPAPFDSLHLNVIRTMASLFNRPVGYSDHSVGIDAPVAAVALGATVLEKHFTLSRRMEGPDHQASLEPAELKRMVEAVHNVQSALGEPIKKIASAEQETKKKVRRSIYLQRDLRAGHTLSEQDIVCLRPLNGIEAIDYELVLGKQLVRSKQAAQPLDWTDFLGGKD